MKHLKITAIALISTLAVGLITTAAAAPPKADTNGDGQVSRAEFDTASEARFAAADTNHDGFISMDERDSSRMAHQNDQYSEHFDRLDSNSDGVLTKEEFSQGISETRGQRRQEFGQRGAQQRGQHRRGGGSWDRIDTDGDNLISAQEYRAGADKMFEHLDANGDGILEQGEGRRKRMRKRRGQRR